VDDTLDVARLVIVVVARVVETLPVDEVVVMDRIVVTTVVEATAVVSRRHT
jgi:hypothetical protein